MKLSKKGEYALRALINIGIAHEMGKPLVQLSELVGHEQIPHNFLEQILIQLKNEGFLNSKRGKYGGYYLAIPPEKIIIGNVIRRLDGPIAPIGCVSQTAYEPCSCPDEAHCGLRMLMLDVRNAVSNIVDRYSLAQIVEVTLRKMRRDQIAPPFSRPTADK
jgi:Rrf2 family protein